MCTVGSVDVLSSRGSPCPPVGDDESSASPTRGRSYEKAPPRGEHISTRGSPRGEHISTTRTDCPTGGHRLWEDFLVAASYVYVCTEPTIRIRGARKILYGIRPFWGVVWNTYSGIRVEYGRNTVNTDRIQPFGRSFGIRGIRIRIVGS